MRGEEALYSSRRVPRHVDALDELSEGRDLGLELRHDAREDAWEIGLRARNRSLGRTVGT
jgi:hypothetical protein